MEILFMIGNGFDINLGMKTSFSSFYDYYCSLTSQNKVIDKMKKEIIKKELYDWSDLELTIGAYSQEISSEDDYILCIRDIFNKLGDYLEEEQKNYIFEKDAIKMIDYFLDFKKYFTNADINHIDRFYNYASNVNVNIINFNYTNSLSQILVAQDYIMRTRRIKDKDFKDSFKKMIHVHGTVQHTMTLGLNDYTQILNTNLQSEKVMNNIVKPILNINAGTLRELDCDELILKANIVIIFGMSIGETDKLWWEKLMNKFMVDTSMLIIIANYDKEISPRSAHMDVYKKDIFKEKLLSFLPNIDASHKMLLKERMIVGFNTELFKFKVKYKEKVV